MGISAGAATLIAGGVSAAAGLAGGVMQSNATSKASGLAANDARIAYLMQDAQLAPYRSAGEQALGQEQGIIGGGWGGYQDQMRAGFQTDPGYEFMLQQGLRGINATQSAAHMFDSGATHKADIAFAEGLANQQYNQYAGRFDNYVNKLYEMSRMGQNSAVQTGTNAGTAATNLGNIAMGQGAADASIYGKGAEGLGNTVNTLFGNKDFQNWIGGGSSIYGNSAPGTPGVSAAGNPVMSGYAAPMTVGQQGVGGFVAQAPRWY